MKRILLTVLLVTLLSYAITASGRGMTHMQETSAPDPLPHYSIQAHASATHGRAPLKVFLSYSASGGVPIEQAWDINDVEVSKKATVTVTLKQAGTYTVVLDSYSACCVASSEVTITVTK
jgi:PKD repeat protein